MFSSNTYKDSYGNTITMGDTSGNSKILIKPSISGGGNCGECKYKPRNREEKRKLDKFINEMRKEKFK
jgi:hypothetical protein